MLLQESKTSTQTTTGSSCPRGGIDALLSRHPRLREVLLQLVHDVAQRGLKQDDVVERLEALVPLQRLKRATLAHRYYRQR
jgi:hypothetical protein